MRHRVPVLLCIGLQAADVCAVNVTGPLVGTWRLVSYTDTTEGEAPILAFGEHPVGQFIFTADGHASVDIMRNPPDITSPTTDPDPDSCYPSWYCSYFGNYEVDYKAGTWVTHVSGGNIPTFIGTDQKRPFSIQGNRLVIAETYQAGGKTVHAERVLIREAGH